MVKVIKLNGMYSTTLQIVADGKAIHEEVVHNDQSTEQYQAAIRKCYSILKSEYPHGTKVEIFGENYIVDTSVPTGREAVIWAIIGICFLSFMWEVFSR